MYKFLVVFLLPLSLAFSQESDRYTSNDSILTRDDLWGRFYRGFNARLVYNSAESGSSLLGGNLAFGLNNSYLFDLSGRLFRNNDITSVLPFMNLQARVVPFIQLDLKFEQSKINVNQTIFKYPFFKHSIKTDLKNNGFLDFRVRADSYYSGEITGLTCPGLYYYFPEISHIPLIGTSGFYADLSYRHKDYEQEISEFYQISDGTRFEFLPILIKTKSDFYEGKILKSWRPGAALLFQYSGQTLTEAGGYYNWAKVRIDRYRAALLQWIQQGGILGFYFNWLEINQQIREFDFIDSYGSTDKSWFIVLEQKQATGTDDISLQEIKQNRDGFFGLFPTAGSHVLNNRFMVISMEGFDGLLFYLLGEGKTGITDNIYIAYGLNCWYLKGNMSDSEFFPRIGFGWRNFNHGRSVEKRTTVTDLLGRVLPPGRFRIEYFTIPNAIATSQYFRKQQFTFHLGLPLGFMLSFCREQRGYWNGVEVSSAFPEILLMSYYTEYPVEETYFFTNRVEMFKRLNDHSVISVDYSYFDLLINNDGGLSARRGHEIMGDYSVQLKCSVIF
jgi:hypothetical protein